jgi:outer membrane protein W
MKRLALLALLVPALAHADKRAYKHWYLRVGGAYMHPFSSSNEMELANVDGPASLAVTNGPIAGSGATVESTAVIAGTLGWRPGLLDGRLAFAIVVGPPLEVKFQATGSLANMSIAPTALGLPTGVPALGPELGQANAVPPLVTAVYSFGGGPITPYLGAGATVLFSYGAEVTNPMLTAVGKPDMSIAPAPGLVLQAGLEAKIYRGWSARLDVKYIAFMLARAEVHHIQMEAPDLPLFGSVEVGTAKMDVWVNPLIIQAGIGTDWDF